MSPEGGTSARPGSFSRVNTGFNRRGGSSWGPHDEDPATAIKSIRDEIEKIYRMIADLYNRIERVSK